MFRTVRFMRLAALLLVSFFALSGCITPRMYVDTALPTVSKNDIAPIAQPKPVQVLYEFRSKGSPNANATSRTQPMVLDVATRSGLFTTVLTTPDGGGVLTISIDNVGDTDAAVSKGVGTGLTMGLVGSMVKDGYLCKATYTSSGKTTEANVQHAIYTTVGNHDGPPGVTAMEPLAAIHLMIEQVTWNLLKQLSDKHAFE